MATTNVTFAIDNSDLPDYIAAFSVNYQPIIDGQANPETQAQFAKRRASEHLAAFVYAYRRKVQDDLIKAEYDAVVVTKPVIT